MDVMRKAIYMLSVLCVAALWGGCQRGGGAEEGTAEVTLRFATRADGTDGTDPNALPNEGIKTLRVILYKDGEIYRVDRLRDFTGDESPVLVKSVKVYDVPLGNITFYLIANEGSIEKTYDTPEAIRADFVEVNGMQKLLVKDEGWKFFPQPAEKIEKNGLPMAGVRTVEIMEDTESLDITLVRAVAKLNLTIENALTEDITVTNINFGNFMSDRVYLFRTQNVDMPDRTTYGEWSSPYNQTIPAGTNGTFVGYVYPSNARTGSNTYTLGLQTTGSNYGPFPIVQRTQQLAYIVRNTQVNVWATISKDATVSVSYEVTDWVPESVNVPPFN